MPTARPVVQSIFNLPCWLFFLFSIIFAGTKCLAADLTIKGREGWHAGDAETRAEIQQTILQKQLNAELLDLSIRDAGGSGTLSRQKYKENINSEFSKQTLAGFLDGTIPLGYTVKSKETSRLGPLSGFRIVMEGTTNKIHVVIINWLLFTKHDVYLASVYGAGDISAATVTETEYLSMIQFSPSIEPMTLSQPLTVTASQKNLPGYQAGRNMVNILYFLLLGVILIVFIGFLRRRTPPPQKPDAAAKSEANSNFQPPDKQAP